MARVKIPALKNQIFKATVTKVVPFVSIAKDQDRTSQIELELNEANDEAGKPILVPVGASADVEIICETKDNVKILPTTAIFGSGKTRFVFKIESGKLIKHDIKVGIGNYERQEILEGVSPTDQIANTSAGIELSEGLKVEAQEKKWP